MTSRELFQAGKINETVQALNAELRDNPGDVKRRTFLFEVLCFAGEYERAEKQLEILGKENAQADMGSLLYKAALHAERTRLDTFVKKEFPAQPADAELRGTLNGKPFSSITDADPRIGARLEAYAAGAYIWIPFKHIEAIEIQPPKRLRDLLWIPAAVKTSMAFKQMELGEVLLPALTAGASKHSNDLVRLGRETHYEEIEGGDVVPVGQKMLLVDDDDEGIAFLDVRKLEFEIAAEEPKPEDGSA
jgi:type VI secretion system protein ImpE